MSAPSADDRVLASRRAWLPCELPSASAARRLLRLALAGTDCSEWIDSAELALGEVVANAVLHAHTAVEVTLEVRQAAVHVEVRDCNPIMPIPRDYDSEAITGRGMALVAALTQDCGVRSLGLDGKVVWFDVGSQSATAPAAEDRLDAWNPWADLAATIPEAQPDDVVEVSLLGLPPLLWLAARQHHDALTRELVLHAAGNDVQGVDIVAADWARGTISGALALRLEGLRHTAPDDHSSSYRYHGSQPWMPPRIDLVVPVSRSLGAAFPALQDTLDTAERLAALGQLFTLPGLPEVIEVRDWVCDQVVAQLEGVPPAPWAGSAQARFETLSRVRVGDELVWDASVVTESLRGVAAGDDANRILAVSRPLAEALGWEVDDLVGRRVVTLIPPSLREAHVAAFTRHLATGQVHAMGQQQRLPVLRKDGTEVMSDFRVERAVHAHGRSIFLAWIEPER